MANLSSEPTSSRVDPASVRRALVIRPRFAGDLCIALPVLEHLARHAPGARVDFLAEEPYARLLVGDPRLAEVIAVPRKPPAAESARLFARLARGGYDLVLDLFCNPRTAVWTAATGARLRVGYRGKGWRSAVYNRHPVHEGKSAVRWHLASIAALGWPVDADAVPQLPMRADEIAAMRARFGLDSDSRLVAIHPGARWPTRQWEPSRYAEVARRAAAEARVLVVGGPGEEDLARGIAEASGAGVTAVTGLDLRELAALLACCDAFVGPDSGPVHIAVAVGTPTVGIFGRNEPERFFPYPASHGHRAVYSAVWCSPCHLDVCSHTSCLRAISPDFVWNALSEILERRAPWPALALTPAHA
jgi:lipopolysaccharide heptosyltransferase II